MSEISRVPSGALQLEKPATTAKDPRNEKVLKAAQMYESHFLREMVREMRKTIPQNELIEPNMAEKMYREQLDDQYVDNWVDRGGVGLGDLIYDQIMERFGNPSARGGLKMLKPPQLPIKDIDKAKLVPLQSDDKKLTLEFRRPQASARPESVVSPWSGKISSNQILSGGLAAIQIAHDNGLHSTLVVRGLPSALQAGATIQAGESIATLGPESSSVVWSLKT